MEGQVSVIGCSEVISVLGLLALLYFMTKLRGRFHKRIFMGILAAFAGMLYYLFVPKYSQFMASMLFFLIPQIYFISAFYLDFKSAPALDKSGARLAIGVAFALSLGFYLLIRDNLGMLRMPVLIGIFTTSLVFMMACFRNLRVNKLSFWLVLGGVVVYMLAEAMFTYHAFVRPFAYAEMTYAITVILGLVLVVYGTIARRLLHTDAAI